ncbi:MAG: LacI family transcriptional regulator [Prevotella sp.]|nr:LacI family transcriptional regulator [Prevotella sp.]
MDSRHNYKTVMEVLRSRLVKGTYAHGTLLPAETLLAQEFNVSRPTIAKVYDQLAREGLVSKKRGIGTVVTLPKVQERSYTFGLLLPGAGESEIFAEINNRILQQADRMGFCCECVGTTANNAETRSMMAVSSLESYIAKKVDGIFFAPFELVRNAKAINHTICEMARKANVPMVLIDRDVVAVPERSPFDMVSLDNYAAGMVMARHMIAAGCKNIYFFANDYSASSVDIRVKSVKLTVMEAELDFFKESYICGNPKDMNVVRRIPIIRRQTGIICANDATAVMLMSSLDELGYRCGIDYLLSGFDNMKYSSFLSAPLTTFQQPCNEIADVSIELLMRRQRDRDALPLTVLLKGQLVERKSTVFRNQ